MGSHVQLKTVLIVALALSACGEAPSGNEPATASRAALSTYDMAVTPLGSLYRPDHRYRDVSLDDIFYAATWSNRYLSTNATRLAAIHWAINEKNRGLCGDTGAVFYDAEYCAPWPWSFICDYDEWCSEFALWVIHHAGIDPGGSLTGRDITRYVTTAAVSDAFAGRGLLWKRGALGPVHAGGRYPRPGDVLFMSSNSDGSRWGHTGLVVGVSNDSRYVYTVEGNTNGHCVNFFVRDYLVDGVLNERIDGVGNVDPWNASTAQMPYRLPASPVISGTTPPDPVCANGILDVETGACCDASCGTCGGETCAQRPGGSAKCCVGRILINAVSCSTARSGCLITDPDCAYGLPSSAGACCAASCGTCGGNGCSGRPGGGAACCIGHITSVNMSCEDQGAPCMM